MWTSYWPYSTYIYIYTPSQQEKIHAHCFVLGPALRIQYTYIYVKHYHHDYEPHPFWIRYTYLALFAGIYLITDTNTHTWKMLLANEFELNTHTYTSKIARNSKCIYSRTHGICIYIYVCMYVCMCIYIYVSLCVWACTFSSARISFLLAGLQGHRAPCIPGKSKNLGE